MSAADRAAIASAAETVTGINCSSYYRQITKTGDASLRLDRLEKDPSGFGFLAVWQVLVALPQDLVAAEKYLDSHLNALCEAVGVAMVVRAVTPSELALDNGTRMPVVVIEGIREHN